MLRRLVLNLLILVLMPVELSGTVAKYHRTVPMGVDFIRGGNMCGGISVNVVSGDFFEGLRSETTRTGRQFRKNAQLVSFFPETLTIMIRIITARCAGPPDARQSAGGVQPDFSFDASFINSLRFEGFWKNGLLMRKAELEVLPSDESRIQGYASKGGTLEWEYDVQIRCPAVPLTDTLVIDVLSSSGKLVSRFSQRF